MPKNETGLQMLDKLDKAASIDGKRLWDNLMRLAEIGATGRGGLNRQALTPDDNEAHRVLVTWARALGLSCFIDDIGNLFVRRKGVRDDAPPVMFGSHLDTQPTGGKFDGIYGVLAGFETLQTFEEAGLETKRPIELAIWANEEGSRFLPGCMGSACYAAPDKLDEWLAITDIEGTTVKEAVARYKAVLSDVECRPLGGAVAAFIEAHIEQGPILETSGNTVGVVTGIQGARDFRVRVLGEEAHAGTTPRSRRKDALRAAGAIAQALYASMDDADDQVRFTIGEFIVSPNSASVVPGRVDFTIDFRNSDQETLRRLGDRVESICTEHVGPCRVEVKQIRWREPATFAPQLPDLIGQAAERLGLAHMLIPSGASHDAVNLQKICPTGMIFVPCEGGLSHNEAESAKPEDLAAGTRVMAQVVYQLAIA